MDNLCKRFWSKVDMSGECWEWRASRVQGGYGQFCVARGNHMLAHRFAYSITHGDIPPGLMVCHKCDNRKCVRPDHLFLGTAKDNVADMIAKGRGNYQRKITRHGYKLTAEQACEIRELYKTGQYTQKQIAEVYGVIKQNVQAICAGRYWKEDQSQ